MADCILLVHLHNHWSDVGEARRRISLRWKLGRVPGLQVKHIHVHVAVRGLVVGMIN